MQAAFPDGHAYVARPLNLLTELDLLNGRYSAAEELITRADSLTLSLSPASRNRAAVGLQRARLRQLQGEKDIATAILDSLQLLAVAAGEQGVDLQTEIADLRAKESTR
jgi:hypothetical protein